MPKLFDIASSKWAFAVGIMMLTINYTDEDDGECQLSKENLKAMLIVVLIVFLAQHYSLCAHCFAVLVCSSVLGGFS